MNKEQKLHSLVLASVAVVMLLILVSSTASASITETRITKNGTEMYPEDGINHDIKGNKIVWTDIRDEGYGIYMYDISTKKETRITTNTKYSFHPAIYGNRVVYDTGQNRIYMYDLSTKKETQIGYGENPVIYGDKIVYKDTSGDSEDSWLNDYKIYMYDLSTKKETQISNNGSAVSLAIYGDKVVWNDHHYGDTDIYMYDLSTKKGTQITTSGKAGNPAIYGNIIVWEDGRSGNPGIYLYDLSTKKESQITASGQASSLDIYGNSVVWNDVRSGNPDIYMYDLSTKKETRITTSGTAYYPKIYDNRIVWLDNRNRNPDTNIGTDIYMATVNPTQSEVLKINDFNAKVRCGTVPLGTEFISDVTGTNIVKWRWDFEPPGKDYYSQHAVSAKHTFTKPGKYDITLTVWNAAGQTETLTKKAYIVVKPLSKR